MQTTTYFRAVMRRQNHVKNFFFNLALEFSSYPRLMIEIFTRRNFGQRYYSTSAVITILLFLLMTPQFLKLAWESLPRDNYFDRPSYDFTGWYIFTVLFAVFAFLRRREVKRQLSTYAGDIHPFFHKLRVFGKPVNIRQIECFYEPLSVFVVGLILSLLGQSVGTLLFWSALFYGFSYAAAYKIGDDYLLDIIDEMIMKRHFADVIIYGKDGAEVQGVRFYATRPRGIEHRQALANLASGPDTASPPIFAE
jgi:ACR3 family arsenite efflux pump ArsB